MKKILVIILSTWFSSVSIAQVGYGIVDFYNSQQIETLYINPQAEVALSEPAPLPGDDYQSVKQKKFKGSKQKYFSTQNPRVSRPYGVNLIYAGSVYLGASIDYFIKPEIDLKVGAGKSGAFAGIEYHIMGFRNNPWTPYTGIFGTYSFEGYIGVYLPFGFQFIHNKGFSFSFELAFWIRNSITVVSETQNIHVEYLGSGSLKIGYHF